MAASAGGGLASAEVVSLLTLPLRNLPVAAEGVAAEGVAAEGVAAEGQGAAVRSTVATTAAAGVAATGVQSVAAITAQVESLKKVAETLRGFKTTPPDHPNLKAVAALIQDPAIRKFGTPIPDKLTDSHPCGISTVYIPRKHLPNGQLSDPLLPILVSEHPQMAMILPERFWPESFREQWCKSEGF